ncbi:release factor glutamine methyltransferase [Kibdelosporangium banguiense]|uniref:Release factor glutamine methyltransferase n=1 Tax=Kibdelosporangium banguiense TaxID=1365924 RepID=A0ABS4TPT9_9PSEU|nr:methyltransferase [Kibdelosporangium banguiense]MBP2326419.1 release factor glutamine methyltransferase [Kibdelosporangium banguiense]
MDERSASRAQALFERNRETRGRPTEFTLLDRKWELLEGVFAPCYTPVTGLFTEWLPYPQGGTFLEVGSGAGVTAVMAALSGCDAVTALDISQAAVENTRHNAELHAVEDRVRVLQSDLFDELQPGDRFDMIFWNSNFVEMRRDFVNDTDLHHAFFDPGYVAHRRYLHDAPRHLTENGRLLLGFTDLGNWTALRRLCAQAGLEISLLRSERRQTEITIEFQLLEIRPAAGRGAGRC